MAQGWCPQSRSCGHRDFSSSYCLGFFLSKHKQKGQRRPQTLSLSQLPREETHDSTHHQLPFQPEGTVADTLLSSDVICWAAASHTPVSISGPRFWDPPANMPVSPPQPREWG